jgi:RNA polymerase sigma factor (sigma-70 family)
LSAPAPVSPSTAADTWLPAKLQEHEPAVRGYLKNRFPSLDSDDVVQESYLRILRAKSAPRFETIKGYFFTVARNTANTIFRRQRLYSATPLDELPAGAVIEEGHDSARFKERRELVAAAIDSLPGRCREVLQLALTEGLPAPAIAERLGIAEATVRVQIAKGIRKCTDYLEERGDLQR